jgi:hypothetical protein
MGRVVWALVTVFVWVIFLITALGKNLSLSRTSNHQTMEDISNDADSNYYPSAPDDVFRVRSFLTNFLPPELVNTILDDAQYWPRIRSRRDRFLLVDASSSALRCLITPPFPPYEALGGPAARLRVKLVTFDIYSNDQGWGGNPQDHGMCQTSGFDISNQCAPSHCRHV